jgi:hypothetical protein
MERKNWSVIYADADPGVIAEAARTAATHDRWIDPCDQIIPGQNDTEPTWLAVQNQSADWLQMMERMISGRRATMLADSEYGDVTYSA